MTKFFQAFNIDGQDVLVVKDQDDEGAPLIFVMMETPGEGTIRISHIYKDDEDGWNTRDKMFVEKAEYIARGTMLSVKGLTSEQEEKLGELGSFEV